MKKALVAGAASAVLAAMPVLGVFAVDGDTFTDYFSFEIEGVCTLTRGDFDGEDAHPTNGSSAPKGETAVTKTWDTTTSPDTMDLGAITVGNIYSMGSSKFHVQCNNSTGYSVTADVSNLTSSNNVAGDSIAPSNSALTAESIQSASGWTAVVSPTPTVPANASAYLTGNDAPVISYGASNYPAGQDFVVTYEVGLNNGQAAGTYTGNIVYTLAQTAISNG